MKTNHVLRFAILAALSSGSAMAQVVFDGTLPGTTAGSLGAVAGTYSINQDRGFVNGRNLFHSFQFFSIDIGETAVFQSTNAIRNIISRVTGNMPTTIDGTLSASNPNITSFWLINPAGIMVGETAVLDIPGAVALGAADTIQFSNGESWSALNSGFSDATTLSVNPMDFGFLGSTAGGLTIRGRELATRAQTRSPTGSASSAAGCSAVARASPSNLQPTCCCRKPRSSQLNHRQSGIGNYRHTFQCRCQHRQFADQLSSSWRRRSRKHIHHWQKHNDDGSRISRPLQEVAIPDSFKLLVET